MNPIPLLALFVFHGGQWLVLSAFRRALVHACRSIGAFSLAALVLGLAACGGMDDAPALWPGNVVAAPTVVSAREVPLFRKPFAGDYPVANYFDHDVPKEFVDNNGTFTTFWGETAPAALAGMVDGHEGYDFWMPTGTPLLAVAPGTVVRVTDAIRPNFCPPLNRYVDFQRTVEIEHLLPDGRRVLSHYTHMDRTDVGVGTVVSAGQQIGLSGNTGCSTGPHLHFEVYLESGGRAISIDPYGWSGSGTDPWEQQPDGAASINLWLPGQAPRLERSYSFDLNTVAPFAPAFLTRVAFEGVHDEVNPNNEYVDLTLDARYATSARLDGYVVRFVKSDVSYHVPSGITLTAQNPTLRIYVGPGTDSGMTAYIGRPSGIVSNVLDDCIWVDYPWRSSAYFNLGGCR